MVASQEKIADLGPVDFGQIETECDPAARADVGREIVAFRLGFGEGSVIAGEDFAGDGDNAVAMMVVKKISEDFFADRKSGVGIFEFARGFGKSEREFGQTIQDGIVGRGFWHKFVATRLLDEGLQISVHWRDNSLRDGLVSRFSGCAGGEIDFDLEGRSAVRAGKRKFLGDLQAVDFLIVDGDIEVGGVGGGCAAIERLVTGKKQTLGNLFELRLYR